MVVLGCDELPRADVVRGTFEYPLLAADPLGLDAVPRLFMLLGAFPAVSPALDVVEE